MLPLPEADQHRLLREAEAGAWSTTELQIAARVGSGPVVARRPPALAAAVRKLERATEQVLALPEIGRADELDLVASVDLHGRVMRVREQLDRLQRALSPKVLAAQRKAARGT